RRSVDRDRAALEAEHAEHATGPAVEVDERDRPDGRGAAEAGCELDTRDSSRGVRRLRAGAIAEAVVAVSVERDRGRRAGRRVQMQIAGRGENGSAAAFDHDAIETRLVARCEHGVGAVAVEEDERTQGVLVVLLVVGGRLEAALHDGEAAALAAD